MSAKSSSSTPQIRLRSAIRPLREQIEIVDQPRHRRVVAVGRLGLQREAFGQAARADAGRVERLDQGQRRLDLARASPRAPRRSSPAACRDSRSRRARRTIASASAPSVRRRRAAARADARPATASPLRAGRNRTPRRSPPSRCRHRRSCRSRAPLRCQSMSSGRRRSPPLADQLVRRRSGRRASSPVSRSSRTITPSPAPRPRRAAPRASGSSPAPRR